MSVYLYSPRASESQMRIILTADNASSRFGGEAFIPLNYFRLMRQRKLDVRLVVHARNRAELTRFSWELASPLRI